MWLRPFRGTLLQGVAGLGFIDCLPVRIRKPREWYLQNLQKRFDLRKTRAIVSSRRRLGTKKGNFSGKYLLDGSSKTNFQLRWTRLLNNLS